MTNGSIDYWHSISREYVCYPRRIIRYPNGSIGTWTEIDMSAGFGRVVELKYCEVIPVLVSEGDGWSEPDTWGIDYMGELVIRPRLTYWGRGLKC